MKAFKFVLLSLLLVALVIAVQGASYVSADTDSTGVLDTQAQTASGNGAAGQAVNTSSALPAVPVTPAQIPTGLQVSDQEFAALKAQAQAGAATLLPADGKFLKDTPQGPQVKAPFLATNFIGASATGWFPPDPTLAAGPSDIAYAVNESWFIKDKAGNPLFSTTLQSWFANVLPSQSSGFSVFDPWFVYDRLGGRFILIAGALRKADKQSFVVVSVSDDSTAAGNWCNWAINYKLNGNTNTNNWADYPKVGVSNNALFLTANMFAFGGGFQYVKMRILDKSVFYNTNCPGYSWYDYWNIYNPDGSKTFTLQPALTMDSGTPEYMITAKTSSTKVFLIRVNNPLGPVRSLSKFTIPVKSYATPPNAQQPGTATLLNTGDTRMLNAEEINGWLWAVHTTACRWSGELVNRSCLRWYQINLGWMNVAQQNTWGAPGLYYFYPAIMADDYQNADIVFSRSGSNEFGSARYTGRFSSDYVNALQGSASLQDGLTTYIEIDTAGRDRWGDYGGISLDPSTGCFWLHHEYATRVANTWGTWIGEACGGQTGAPAH